MQKRRSLACVLCLTGTALLLVAMRSSYRGSVGQAFASRPSSLASRIQSSPLSLRARRSSVIKKKSADGGLSGLKTKQVGADTHIFRRVQSWRAQTDDQETTILLEQKPSASARATMTTLVYQEQEHAGDPSLDAYEAALRRSIEDEEKKQLNLATVLIGQKEGNKIRGKEPELWIEGDSTEVTTFQKATTVAVWTISALLFADATSHMVNNWDPLVGGFVVGFTILFSDLFSGIFHWAVDNYGSLKTPILGSIIHSFQGHHSAPWTITYRPFFNNVYKIALPCLVFLSMVLISTWGTGNWEAQLAAIVFFNMQILGQEFHKLSHMIKTPPLISKLQKMGILLSKKNHLAHHTSPHDSRYCIVTGHMNGILDSSNFFRHLEKVVYRLTGDEPNCWKLKPEMKTNILAGKFD